MANSPRCPLVVRRRRAVVAGVLATTTVLAAHDAPVADGAAVPTGHVVLAGVRDHGPMGPDPPPPGVDLSQERALDDVGTATDEQLACVGDGTSGPRVQAVYAHPVDRPDRSAAALARIPVWAARADRVFADAAAAAGATRHVRFVTNPDCTLAIDVVHLSAAAGDSFSVMRDELRQLGYVRADRKVLVWMDEVSAYCGIAEVRVDDRPGPENVNDGASVMFGRVDSPCWGIEAPSGPVEAHELVHLLGGVQPSAPHATPHGHCTDEHDLMCYADGPDVVVEVRCPDATVALLDCGNDDYFSVAPAPGSYLATHWNVATSSFLSTTPPWVANEGGEGGYVLAAADGGVFGFGSAPFLGSVGGMPLARPVTALAARPDADGYWLVGEDGGVFAFGAARFLGSSAGRGERAVTGATAHPSGDGYWVVRESGAVEAFGAAPALGGAGGPVPWVGIAATRSGGGYWLADRDGRVVARGDAVALGDASGLALDGAVVDIVATPSGDGYWLVASDGGVFAFGAAVFAGSTGAMDLNAPIVGMAPTPTGLGYVLAAADGGVFTFGDAQFRGSMARTRLNQPIVAVRATP
jgi:hypothetical protein